MTTLIQHPPLTATELVRAHQAGVWRYLRYLGCDPSLADDLTQETFVAVLQNLPENRGQAAVASYLRTAARRQFLQAMRKRGKTPEAVELDLADEVWAQTLGTDDGSEAIRALDDCREKLTDRAQAAIDAKYTQRMSREQIAESLEMSVDGVKTLLRRTRLKLRECIERKLNHD